MSVPTHRHELVTYRRFPQNALRRVSKRLERIKQRPPSHVPRLIEYGFVDGRIRIAQALVKGSPLSEVSQELAPQDWADLREMLFLQTPLWREEGFIHGDLSPSNILIDRDQSGAITVAYVDWTLDLEGFEATPLFAAPEVFRGKRSFESDRHSISEILRAYGVL
ncbi:MAG: hypothetical protein AB1540_15615 [Bdellovibrionota bacterium]